MKNNFLLLIKYTRNFIAFSGMKTVRLVLYSAMTGFTQGVGVFMLIPFLAVAGAGNFPGHNVEGNRIFQLFLEIFKFFGLPLNLFYVLSVFVGIIIFIRFIQYRQDILAANIRNSYIGAMQSGLFHAVIFADWRFIADQRSSNIAHVVTTDLPIVSNGTYFFLKILTTLVISIIYITWAMLISIELTIFTIFFGGLSFIFLKFCLPYSIKSGASAREARSKIYSLLLDHLHGLKIAKSYGAEQREYAKFKEAAAKISQTQTGMVSLNSKTKIVYALITNLMLCVFLYISISILKTPLSSLFLLIVIFSKLLPNISSFQNDFQHLLSMLPSFEAAEDLLAKAESHQEDILFQNNPAPLKLTKSIKIENLSFSYPAAEDGFVIKNLDLEIPALQTTAIIGESGIGKSTIADIITGILKPDSGGVFVDDTRIDGGNLLQWRQSVGYLPQESFLFHDTIRNNILWGKPDATDKEIEEALRLASAYDFVNKLPEGLDTVVKDRGQRLSGGERQRIALARTLIRNPQMLLLDEATSSLDMENESRIYESISKLHGKMTIVFITHRPETLKFADSAININEIFAKLQTKPG